MKVYILKQNLRRLEKEYTYFSEMIDNDLGNVGDMYRLSEFNLGMSMRNKF